jgi:hypothetical protein
MAEQDANDAAEDHPTFHRFKHWIERRLAHRRDVKVWVLVLQGTRIQSGILVEMNEGGFGLGKVDRLIPDEFISIATPDGRVLEGRVVWAEDGRAGVALLSRS